MNEVKRPSLREAARRGVEANRQAKQAPSPPKPTPAPVPAATQPAQPAEAATLTEKQPQAKQTRREKPRPRLGRLPHGATFHVVYDGMAVRWSGTLTVPQGGIYNATVVSGEESAVFTLLMSLDRAYRKLPAEEATPQETPSAGVADNAPVP